MPLSEMLLMYVFYVKNVTEILVGKKIEIYCLDAYEYN